MSAPSFVDRRARELASDPTLNVALEASAGTGKTRVLVDRYVRLVEEGSSPRHILAITFTRKAAGEMKSRILEELKRRSTLWAEVRNRLFDVHVTTIDAFCLGLLREFPLEAGLDPDLALLDQVETERLLEGAIAHVLSPSRRAHSVDLPFLVAKFGEGALERGLRDFLQRRLVKEELLARYVAQVPPGIDLVASLRRFSEALDGAFRGAAGASSFLATLPPGLEALPFALERALDPERVTAAFVDVVASYFLTASGEPRKRLSPAARRARFSSPADYERHRDQVLGLAPLVARAHRQWLREKDLYAVREIGALYRAGAKRFAELKQAVAGLDFTDVLVAAVELLERRGEFSQSRYRLESRYHHLLIDEFQDTNEVQLRLVSALIDSWGEGAGLVQEAILEEQAAGSGRGKIREPSLFLVGDRKQSIYGFRDARVEVLEKASRRLLRIRKGGGQRLTLRHSFRAEGELLAFLNDVFAALPKARRDLDWSFQYREADHFPVAERDSEARPVALAVAEDLGRAAAIVADETVRLLQEGGRRPRDVAILFRSRTSYRVYEEALAERDVPAYVYRGLGFFDSAEVRDVAALVRFLAEPGSELRAAELARSRFVGVSDAALVRLASRRRRGSSDTPLSTWLASGRIGATGPLSSEDEAAFERAARLAPAWLRVVDRIPPAELIERVLRETDYGAWFVGREQSWENVKKILELVRRAENRGYLTLSRLADYLESAATGEESPAALEAVDAVNLMTIHAAKGLEFDSVFLVNLHQRTREDTSLPRIREHPDGRVDVSALASLEKSPPGEPSRVEEEEKRLLYVALTRARRSLTLSTVATSERDEGTLLSLFPESLRDVLRRAAATDEREIVWGSHRLRVLRPAAPRTFQEARPVAARRLRLEPLVAERSAPARRPMPKDAAIVRALHRWIASGRPKGALQGEARALYESLDRGELERLLASGRLHAGLELALARGAGFDRARVESLVLSNERATVIDFATPGARSSHRLAIDGMLESLETLFPGRRVEAVLFSPGHPPETLRRGPGSERTQLALF